MNSSTYSLTFDYMVPLEANNVSEGNNKSDATNFNNSNATSIK